MPLKTTIIISETQSSSVEQISNGMSGYRLDMSVDSAVNISSKIFIMQREVLSIGVLGEGEDEPFEDTLYSVASVPEMESVPEAPTSDVPFYRVSSISLVFGSLEDLNKGRNSILELIGLLQRANDGVINLLPGTKLSFPPQAIARFWGYTTETTITDEILLEGNFDTLYQIPLYTPTLSLPGPRYLYFAMPASLGEIGSMKVNGSVVAFNSVTRSVVTIGGCSVSYVIYVTQGTIGAGNVALEITSPS